MLGGRGREREVQTTSYSEVFMVMEAVVCGGDSSGSDGGGDGSGCNGDDAECGMMNARMNARRRPKGVHTKCGMMNTRRRPSLWGWGGPGRL
jgi:hypothetical protein